MARKPTGRKAKSESPPRDAARDRERLLEYFMANPDRPIPNAELAKLLGASRTDSWTRRLRELREPRHGGYEIQSRRDRADLRPDEYLFPAQARREAIPVPRISGKLRAEVMLRDAYTCQACGVTRADHYPDGRRVTLHVAHNLAGSLGGSTTLHNCFTLCSRCNEAESNIGSDRPRLEKTMAQVRRLPDHEKREIYFFLKKVFEK